jgi:hypothetical protein
MLYLLIIRQQIALVQIRGHRAVHQLLDVAFPLLPHQALPEHGLDGGQGDVIVLFVFFVDLAEVEDGVDQVVAEGVVVLGCLALVVGLGGWFEREGGTTEKWGKSGKVGRWNDGRDRRNDNGGMTERRNGGNVSLPFCKNVPQKSLPR